MQERIEGLERCQGGDATPGTQLFARAKQALTDGEPVIMMQYMRPDARHIVSIETMEHPTATCSPNRSMEGDSQPGQTDCDSSLSSIGGDLMVTPVGESGMSCVNYQTNDLFTDYSPNGRGNVPPRTTLARRDCPTDGDETVTE